MAENFNSTDKEIIAAVVNRFIINSGPVTGKLIDGGAAQVYSITIEESDEHKLATLIGTIKIGRDQKRHSLIMEFSADKTGISANGTRLNLIDSASDRFEVTVQPAPNGMQTVQMDIHRHIVSEVPGGKWAGFALEKAGKMGSSVDKRVMPKYSLFRDIVFLIGLQDF